MGRRVEITDWSEEGWNREHRDEERGGDRKEIEKSGGDREVEGDREEGWKGNEEEEIEKRRESRSGTIPEELDSRSRFKGKI